MAVKVALWTFGAFGIIIWQAVIIYKIGHNNNQCYPYSAIFGVVSGGIIFSIGLGYYNKSMSKVLGIVKSQYTDKPISYYSAENPLFVPILVVFAIYMFMMVARPLYVNIFIMSLSSVVFSLIFITWFVLYIIALCDNKR